MKCQKKTEKKTEKRTEKNASDLPRRRMQGRIQTCLCKNPENHTLLMRAKNDTEEERRKSEWRNILASHQSADELFISVTLCPALQQENNKTILILERFYG
jgi:hypothetical protein